MTTTAATQPPPSLRLLIYSDGGPDSIRALRFGAGLARRTNADMAILTVRSGTHAIEPHPPFGEALDFSEHRQLPAGLQVMARALDVLGQEGLLDRRDPVELRELSRGYMFACQAVNGKRIPFYVHFGYMIDVLNREIDRHHYDLLIVSPPRRSSLRKWVMGDTTRKLMLDVHTSLLFVRGGHPQSRFMVCADGSPAAKRQFPMIRRILPAISPPLQLICIQTPDSDTASVREADHCLEQAGQWLTACGKQVEVVRLQGEQPARTITAMAGEDAVIVVADSLRHDLYRRLVGSMATRILALADASVLVVKGLPEGDPDVLEDQKVC